MPAGKPQSLIGSPGELPPSPFGGMQTRSGKKMWGAAKAKVQAVQAMEGKGSLLAARKLAAETSAAKKAELKAELARENAAMKKRLQAMNIGRDAKALDPEVEEARRNFAKHPVVQMQVAPELGVLVSLTSEVVQLNALPSLDMSAQLLKTRGAHSFTLSLDLSPAVLCVAVRNRLLLYRWDGGAFNDWKDVTLPDVATQHVACGDAICVAAGKTSQPSVLRPSIEGAKVSSIARNAPPLGKYEART